MLTGMAVLSLSEKKYISVILVSFLSYPSDNIEILMGGAWVWSKGTFWDLGTMILGFPIKFYLLIPISGPIQQLLNFRGG